MAKGTKIKATFSGGYVLTRTTTLPLTHAWCWSGTRDDGSKAGNSGFASSKDKAERAMASDSGYVTKPSKWNNNKVGKLIASEVVAVEVVQ